MSKAQNGAEVVSAGQVMSMTSVPAWRVALLEASSSSGAGEGTAVVRTVLYETPGQGRAGPGYPLALIPLPPAPGGLSGLHHL